MDNIISLQLYYSIHNLVFINYNKIYHQYLAKPQLALIVDIAAAFI